MQFLTYHRDRAGSTPLRVAMAEEHWAYMDGYADALVARGPTLADDDTLAGSLHVVDVPDPAAARAFAFEEPCYQAGAYRDVLVRRTRWTRNEDAMSGFLVLGFLPEPSQSPVPLRDGLLASGPLLSDDGTLVLGVAALVRDPGDVTTDVFAVTEVHRWERGGRR